MEKLTFLMMMPLLSVLLLSLFNSSINTIDVFGQSGSANTVTVYLTEDESSSSEPGSYDYDITGIESNHPLFKGIEVGSGSSYVSVDDATIGAQFPIKVPDPSNPNRVSVSEAWIFLDVHAIETIPENGLKNYYAQQGNMRNQVDELPVMEGSIQQTNDTNAVLTLVLGQ